MDSLLVFLFTVFQFTTLVVSAERLTYVIHMDKSFMPKPFTHPNHWYSSIVDSLISSTLVYTYDNALHGFSAVLSELEVDKLKRSPGVVSLYRDDMVTLQTTHSSKFLSLNPAYGLWPASQYGKDVIIGVLDTGISPESPSFNDNGMGDVPARWKGICEEGKDFNASLCNKKLIGVRYFSKGWKAANQNKQLVVNSGRDTDGHGTHTSSIAAGNYVKDASFFGYATGTTRGMAPRAHVAMYKIGPSGRRGIYVSDVIAAVDQAIGDGVDVLSLSIDAAKTRLYKNPIAIASFAAMENGIFVSCAAGNSGPSERVSNAFPWVLTVAASSIDRLCAGSLVLGNGVSIKGWTTFPAKAIVKNAPLIYNRTISACNSAEAIRAADAAVIICQLNGSLDVNDQLTYFFESGVVAVILISDEAIEDSLFRFPGVVISTKDAQAVIDYAMRSAHPVATIEFQQTFLGEKIAPTVATYSSHGPSASYPGILKPDLMAPGTLIVASWAPDRRTALIGENLGLTSEFSMESGTSMACPHAAGIAALLKAVHPEWTPAAIRSAMMTTASPFDNSGDYIRDDGLKKEIATPLAMGSGQVNPNAALHPGLIYDVTSQDYVSLLCSMNLTELQIKTITRSTYNCSNPSSDLNYPSFIAFYVNGTTTKHVKRFHRTVTNVGEGAATYRAKVIAPQGSLVDVHPKKMVFGEKYEKQSYSVTLSYRGDSVGKVTFGSLTWVENKRNYVVRSPIVVSPVIKTR